MGVEQDFNEQLRQHSHKQTHHKQEDVYFVLQEDADEVEEAGTDRPTRNMIEIGNHANSIFNI